MRSFGESQFLGNGDAEYQDCEAVIMIQTGEVCGQIPKRGLNLIWEWIDLHQSELLENWENARQRKPLNRINSLL